MLFNAIKNVCDKVFDLYASILPYYKKYKFFKLLMTLPRRERRANRNLNGEDYLNW